MHQTLWYPLRVFSWLALVALTYAPVQAQSLLGRLETTLLDGPDGRTLEVRVQLRSDVDPALKLGPSTLQFSYNAQALSFPPEPEAGESADYQFLAGFGEGPYGQSTVTGSTPGLVSLNIFIFAPGSGTPIINTDYMDVAVIRLKVTDVTKTSDLAWTSCEYSDDTFVLQEDDCSGFEDNSVALPVELKDMGVEHHNGHGLLRWTTLSETHNAGFEVQHTAVQDQWQTLGWVAGAGTTTEPQQYTFSTPNLDPGRHQFRLKQVDFDGTFAYSENVELAVGVAGRYLLKPLYPNPFSTAKPATVAFAVAAAQHVHLRLYDALGRLVRTLYSGPVEADQTQALQVAASGLAGGTYLLRLEGETVQAHRTVTLIK